MKLFLYLGALLAPTLVMSVAHADGRSYDEMTNDFTEWARQKGGQLGESIRESISGVAPKPAAPGESRQAAPVVVKKTGNPATVCIGYGTEKEDWLFAEAKAFTQANPEITLQLIGTGSFEGARALSTTTNGEVGVVQGEGRVFQGGQEVGTISSCAMTVWAPASSLFRNYAASRVYNDGVLRGSVKLKDPNDVFAGEADSLVQSPMVFVLWKNNTLAKLVNDLNSKSNQKIDMNRLNDPKTIQALSNSITISYLMAEQSKASADRPRPLNITNPLNSNSGFSFVYILSGELLSDPATASQSPELQINPDLGVPAAATDPQNEALWLPLLKMVTRDFGGKTRSLNNFLEDSTGTLMKSFLVRGPTVMGGIMTYENLALKMGALPINQADDYQIVYPKINITADHPYYILNLPNRSNDQKKAATVLMRFLRAPEAQALAVEQGFRPGVSGLNVSLQDSPAFRDGLSRGVTLDLTSVGTFVPTLVEPQTTANIEEGFKTNILASVCAVPENKALPKVYKACAALGQR